MTNGLSRRALLSTGLGIAGVGALAACSGASSPKMSDSGSTGRATPVSLSAVAGAVDLGGVTVNTWSFGGTIPAPQIRLSAGDTLHAQIANHLQADTSVHWHGVAVPNAMDGVPPITQQAVAAGSSFDYRFIARNPGTYWFHPHVGVQLDRGLYGALIVEDPKEPLSYDDEWVLVFDDWLDGVSGNTPDAEYTALTTSMSGMGNGMGMGMSMGGVGTSTLLGGDAGDVTYPYHLVNGRIPADPDVYDGKPGARVRLRMINAGSDTAYRVALGGHRLTLTHTDGYPIDHQDVDAVLIAPGERYDALVTLAGGVFPLVALAEGKNALGRALVRTGSGGTPPANARPGELDGMLMSAAQLTSEADARLAAKAVARTHRIKLTGGMGMYDWSLDGVKFDMNDPAAHPYLAAKGERVRLEFVNTTTMWHPMHLHGHTFQLGATGPRKDTVIVLPGQTVTCDFDADNPGQWMLHCHNAYHGQAGMMGLVSYAA
ncbi:MAG TPA: multicopper oxidase family protein [Actinospica sp.]|nr:multicopper oxidase family protein [Actinospica sp.]